MILPLRASFRPDGGLTGLAVAVYVPVVRSGRSSDQSDLALSTGRSSDLSVLIFCRHPLDCRERGVRPIAFVPLVGSMVVVGVIVGFVVGALAAWLLARARGEVRLAQLETALEHEQRTVELWKTQFEQNGVSAAHELQRRHEAIEQLVKPIKESLQRVDGEVRALEQSRRQDYGSLTT